MDIPINCPICGDPLINTFNETILFSDKVVYKNCRLRPDHIFSCTVYLKGFWNDNTDDHVDRVAFTLSMSPILSVLIWPVDKTTMIASDVPTTVSGLPTSSKLLPFYVEPNFYDHTSYSKWVKKLKTYLLFS
jgi:hypothetical protein